MAARLYPVRGLPEGRLRRLRPVDLRGLNRLLPAQAGCPRECVIDDDVQRLGRRPHRDAAVELVRRTAQTVLAVTDDDQLVAVDAQELQLGLNRLRAAQR